MYYKNPLRRFLFRKKLLRKIRARIRYYKRKTLRNEYDDIRFLFDVAGFEPSAIVDGGANIGFVTYQFARRFPSSKIYAIEPNPHVFDKLKTAYEADARIHTLNMGISRESGKLAFNINANTGTSSFLTPNEYHATHLAKNRREVKEVETISLSDLVIREHLDGIDLLKLDIEGFELEALKGAEQLLRDQRIHAIVLEANLIGSYVGQPLFHEVSAFLAERGYSVFNSYGLHETPIRQSIFMNLVFLSKTFRKLLKERFGNNCGW